MLKLEVGFPTPQFCFLMFLPSQDSELSNSPYCFRNSQSKRFFCTLVSEHLILFYLKALRNSLLEQLFGP